MILVKIFGIYWLKNVKERRAISTEVVMRKAKELYYQINEA